MANWMKQLNQMEGAVDFQYNPFAPENVIRSPSPYLNWIFGKGSGLPRGYGCVLYGPPKSGKSLISYLMTAGVHAQNKDAIVLKYNTEMREAAQISGNWGIDFNRYSAFDVNDASMIFDRIKTDILPMLEAGMPLQLIIIDSLQGVMGIKEKDRESINDHLVGDHAQTIQNGLKLILPILRKYKISLICTEHIRSNLDIKPGPAAKYAKKEKMAGGWAEKHFFEYYLEVKKDNSAEGKQDALGKVFEDDTVDARGNKGKTGHKIYVKMDESSVGVAGRSGVITFSYNNGLINIEEEVFELAKSFNLIERPNNRTYIIEGQKYNSKEEFIIALKNDEIMRNKIISSVYDKDKK